MDEKQANLDNLIGGIIPTGERSLCFTLLVIVTTDIQM